MNCTAEEYCAIIFKVECISHINNVVIVKED